MQDNARNQDEKLYQKKKPPLTQYLLHASKDSGRGIFSLTMEYLKLRKAPGRLTLEEYVQYGVYKNELSMEEKSRFLTNTLHWPITAKCCDMSKQQETEDKWQLAKKIKTAGLPIPETMAMIDKTDKAYPDTLKITSLEEFKRFAQGQKEPVFAKENYGIASFGVFILLEADESRVNIEGQGWMGYEKCWDELIGDTTYIIQPIEKNHKFFDDYTQKLATVRVCILLEEDVHIPFAVLKLPGAENLADSFWRAGNLACDVDPYTGEVLKVRKKSSFGTVDNIEYPGNGKKLIGQKIPMWSELVDLAKKTAPCFSEIKYQSMDIAITEKGPVLIEVNTGGGFDLPQLASGRGFLTDEVYEFFKKHNFY